MSDLVLPNFLLIGAEKAGTTALSRFLRQHPDVCFSRPKETWFFNRRYDRGIKWFASHFEHWEGETAIGEGTARLLSSQKAPTRIRDHISQVQLICILRNPIDRAFSQYHFYVYTGKVDPDRSFGEVIRDESSEFGRDLIQQGKYIEHLRRYESLFGREQMHVVLHRTFRNGPLQVVEDIYRTLGMDPSFTPNAESDHNVTRYPASRTVYEILRKGWHTVGRRVQQYVPFAVDTLRKTVRRLFFGTEKPEIPDRDRAFLRKKYAGPNQELADWMGRGLPHWD
jgi:hypothetical protein